MEFSKDKIIEAFQATDLELILIKPTVNVLREAKFRYNRSFTSALKEGLSTKKKLEEQLRQGEVNIIDIHVNKRSELLKLYAETNSLLLKTTDPDLLDYYADLLSFYRDSMVREDTEMTNLFATTADQLAEDARIDFLTYSLTRLHDGTTLWDSEETYFNDTRVPLIETCKYHVICWEYKLDPNWQESLPESKARVLADSLREEVLDKSLKEADKVIEEGDKLLKELEKPEKEEKSLSVKSKKLKKRYKLKTKSLESVKMEDINV